LHITKGEGLDLLVSAGQIPADFKVGLDSAVTHNSHELRAAARGVTNSIERAFEVE